MGDNSGIEWTDATWNPTVGCTKVSPGCDHCYAETLVNRFAGHNKGFPNRFDVMTLRGEDHLTLPLRWQKPRRVFVNSLSDLFHTDVPDEFIARVFAVMALAGQHTFQLLTKRHARMRSLLSSPAFADEDDGLVAEWVGRLAPAPCVDLGRIGWPLPNVWLGVSVENQQWADIRIPALLDTPAAVRFLSCEPLLGPVDLRICVCGHRWDQHDSPDGYETSCTVCFNDETQEGCADYESRTDLTTAAVDWVIAGGESGPGARPMHPDWVRSLRDQCAEADVPFLFKQWGNWAPHTSCGVQLGDVCMTPDGDTYTVDRDYICAHNESDGTWLRNVGKKAAGRLLDGRTWDEFPAMAHA